MHRQQIQENNRLSDQYIVHALTRPIAARLKSRRVVGPYVCRRSSATAPISFYLDSDFSPELRYQYADDIAQSIQHRGWFTDDEAIGETIRGLVGRLPHGRGFLAGWTMGPMMASGLERDIYTDEITAAFAADSIAENLAESEREYHRELYSDDNGD